MPQAERARHIGWDIGAGELGLELGRALDATVVRQSYSRLVIDCNREPSRADAMPEISDGTPIPANVGLTPQARAARVANIHAPYHEAIAALLDARGPRPTALLLLHSFTPVMRGHARPWRYGVLHNGGALALAMLDRLRAEPPPRSATTSPMRWTRSITPRFATDRTAACPSSRSRCGRTCCSPPRAAPVRHAARALLPEALAAIG